jgi:hypothetical protein
MEFVDVKIHQSTGAAWFSQYHRGVLGWWFLDSISAVLMVLIAWWLSPAHAAKDPGYFDPHFSPVFAAVMYAVIFPTVSHIFGFHNPLMQRDKLALALKYAGVAGLSVTLLALVELLFFYTRRAVPPAQYVCPFERGHDRGAFDALAVVRGEQKKDRGARLECVERTPD